MICQIYARLERGGSESECRQSKALHLLLATTTTTNTATTTTTPTATVTT